MLLRPAPATWFELLVVRDELPHTLQVLAATRQVQLQGPASASALTGTGGGLLPAMRSALDQYRRLAERYAPFWPLATASTGPGRRIDEVPRAAIERLQSWSKDADPLIARLQQLASENSELARLRGLLSVPSEPLPNLSLFGAAGPLLASRAYLLAPATGAIEIPSTTLSKRILPLEGEFLLALGPAADIRALDETLGAQKAHRLAIPAKWPASLAELDARMRQIESESGEVRAGLARLSEAHAIASALGDLHLAEWIVAHVPELTMTPRFASITGWTTASSTALHTVLEKASLDHLLRFPEAPPGLVPPIVLHNPRWVQPFELFARLLGVPGAAEADPSRILALLAPVMFGFMFGDVGQGAALLVTGLALRRRFPALALLAPGGAAAMLFGLLFGSVFARESVLPALWMKPLQHPLTLLLVSLAFGSGVILLGLALDALQSSWAGRARLWWSTRAGIVLSYVGVIGSALDTRALWALPVGLGWCSIGSAAMASAARGRAAAASLGTALETLMQLLINTLSFVRIGAFALAHAGLASAITGLAAATGSRPMFWLVLSLGNAFVLVMEGLIVAIQTTRLVLFEFFVRFLHGSGRPFEPLPLPLPQDIASSPPRSRFPP